MANRNIKTRARLHEEQSELRRMRSATRALSPAAADDGCVRCGGLLVRDYCVDVVQGGGELTAARCIQCGDVVDAVILANRQMHAVGISNGPAPVLRGIALGHPNA